MSDGPAYNAEGRRPSPTFQFNYPTVVSLLYLGGYITGGVSTLIGLILAYIWQSENPSGWEASHYRFHIRTFWLGLLQVIVGGLLFLVVIGWLILLWWVIWTALRTIKAMLQAQKELPMENSSTLLW